MPAEPEAETKADAEPAAAPAEEAAPEEPVVPVEPEKVRAGRFWQLEAAD